MRQLLSTQQAARRLEVGEDVIRRAIRAERIRVVVQGSRGRAHQLDPDDVDQFGLELRCGDMDRQLRTVLVVDPEARLTTMIGSLSIAALEPVICSNLLEATDRHEIDGKPIVVMEVPSWGTPEFGLLDVLAPGIELILIGAAVFVPDSLAPTSRVCDPFEYRRLVRLCWGLVEGRRDRILEQRRNARSAQAAK